MPYWAGTPPSRPSLATSLPVPLSALSAGAALPKAVHALCPCVYTCHLHSRDVHPLNANRVTPALHHSHAATLLATVITTHFMLVLQSVPAEKCNGGCILPSPVLPVSNTDVVFIVPIHHVNT